MTTGAGTRNRAPREVQTGEQVRAGSVVLVVAIGGRNQPAGVANDHSGTPESLGEQILVIAAEVRPAASERPEPRRRRLNRRHRPALTTSLGKHGLNPVVRQLLDQPPQLVPLGTHTVSLDPAPSTSAAAVPGGHETAPTSTDAATQGCGAGERTHRHHRHVTRHNIAVFAEVTRVELRGLEPLTL